MNVFLEDTLNMLYFNKKIVYRITYWLSLGHYIIILWRNSSFLDQSLNSSLTC